MLQFVWAPTDSFSLDSSTNKPTKTEDFIHFMNSSLHTESNFNGFIIHALRATNSKTKNNHTIKLWPIKHYYFKIHQTQDTTAFTDFHFYWPLIGQFCHQFLSDSWHFDRKLPASIWPVNLSKQEHFSFSSMGGTSDVPSIN